MSFFFTTIVYQTLGKPPLGWALQKGQDAQDTTDEDTGVLSPANGEKAPFGANLPSWILHFCCLINSRADWSINLGLLS